MKRTHKVLHVYIYIYICTPHFSWTCWTAPILIYPTTQFTQVFGVAYFTCPMAHPPGDLGVRRGGCGDGLAHLGTGPHDDANIGD